MRAALLITGLLATLPAQLGCRTAGGRFATAAPSAVPSASRPDAAGEVAPVAYEAGEPDSNASKAGDEDPQPLPPVAAEEVVPEEALPEQIKSPTPQPQLELAQVIESVRSNFPLIEQAAAARVIASGEALGAMGAFDHKLDAFSNAQPLDFYENYWSRASVKRDTMWGGQTFAGYGIGRGDFEPWYLERETNRGGEFKAGFMAPIVRDRWIDANRAALWQAQLERRRVEPEILSQVILFVRNGSVAYWSWVAAGENRRIAHELLEVARVRNKGIAAKVEVERDASLMLVDNRRIIVSREAKLIDAGRKLQQAGIKLSLFFRTPDGMPSLPDEALLPPGFPPPLVEGDTLEDDTSRALAQRPELAELQFVRRQYEVALRQARNETWCDVDAGLLVGQDMGSPTSPKRDKSEFELEALVTVSVPLERRKALGKVRSLRGKLAQVGAKTRFTADKIVADVQVARAAILAARQRVERTTENLRLAEQIRDAEQDRFDLGRGNLFELNIREQQAAEAALERVAALLEYHVARADYAFALGFDQGTP